MFGQELPFSTYQDLDNYLRTQTGLALVVFVSRNSGLQCQVAALKYLMGRHGGSLPIFVLPGGYCDPERVKYNIASYPTYIFLDAGVELARFVGSVTGRRLEDFYLLAAGKGSQKRGTENFVAQDSELPLQ